MRSISEMIMVLLFWWFSWSNEK